MKPQRKRLREFLAKKHWCPFCQEHYEDGLPEAKSGCPACKATAWERLANDKADTEKANSIPGPDSTEEK